MNRLDRRLVSTAGVSGVPLGRKARGAVAPPVLGGEIEKVAINWFRGKSGKSEQEQEKYTIDDLIVLERYDEAETRLRTRLRENPADLHSHLKLAEVCAQLRQYEKAVDAYVHVAEEYAQDGFHDKGIALLSKAMKLAPLNQSLRYRVERLHREKGMEHLRSQALEGLSQAGGMQAGTSALELKRLWHNLAGSPLVQRLALHGEQLKRLFSTMELVRFESQVKVAGEGSQEALLLLIVIGVVEAAVRAEGRAVTVRSFTSGDVVGEMALLERGAWPADYRATEPVTALKLTREGLERCLTGNPDPRGFLEALREQHNDREVLTAVQTLRTGS